MDTMIPIILVILHLVCCVLIYIGIELKILKVKRYLMPFVILVPVSGVICCLILHFQLFLRGGNKTAPSIGKMKNDQDIYRSIVTEHQDTQKEIIPLEEALIVNDTKTRRNLIMDVLNDHPEKYLDVLLQARMNEDADVAHYATTSMVELSKSYDEQLRQLEERLSINPGNDAILEEFCTFFKTYLNQGIAKGKIQMDRRERYSQLLEQRLEHEKTLSLLAELTENELDLKHYDKVSILLTHMESQWRDEEKYQMLQLRYYVEMKQHEKINQQIAYIDSRNIYITQENRKKLGYWRTPEYEKENKYHEGETVSL